MDIFAFAESILCVRVVDSRFSNGKLLCGERCGCTILNDSYWITWCHSVYFLSLRGHCEWIWVFDALRFAANEVNAFHFHSSRCWFTSLNRQLKFIKLNSACMRNSESLEIVLICMHRSNSRFVRAFNRFGRTSFVRSCLSSQPMNEARLISVNEKHNKRRLPIIARRWCAIDTW